MRLLILSIFFAFLQSCTPGTHQEESFSTLLNDCSEVNINFYNGGDTVHFQTTDSLGIKRLSETVLGRIESVSDSCSIVGELYFRKQTDTLLKSEFAVFPASNTTPCNYLMYNYQGKAYKHRLTEKAYKLLVQMYPKPMQDSLNQSIDTTTSMDSSKPLIDTGKK